MHRAVGSPALCGLKLLCEFSQAGAGKGNRKRGRKTPRQREAEIQKHPGRTVCRNTVQLRFIQTAANDNLLTTESLV